MGFLPPQPVLTEGGEARRREGPSEIPLCVEHESFCLCELKHQTVMGCFWPFEVAGRGVSELNTGLCLDMLQFKTDSAAV